jgi:hypothetical protein
VSSEGDEAGDDDEYEHDELEDTEEVLEAETPFDGASVDEEGEGDAGEADETEGPAAGCDIGSSEDVFSENERVTGSPCCESNVRTVGIGGRLRRRTEQHSIRREHRRDQELRSPEQVLQIVLLSSVLGHSLDGR